MSATGVIDATHTGIRAVLADPGPRRQRLPGFDTDYHDIVHYILRCTYRIWEQRQLGLIRTHYADQARVVTIGGESRSAQAVIDATRAMQTAFPDRRLHGEDVIWCRLPGGAGFFSSHRIRSTMTHVRASEFGRADGSAACFRTIADCYVRANRIHLEWLARDNFAIALQLGKDPFRLAAAMARRESIAFARWRQRMALRVLSRGTWESEAPGHPGLVRTVRNWGEAWVAAINARRWQLIEKRYAPRVAIALPRGELVRSAAGSASYWSSLVAALPDLRIALDRATCLTGADGEQRLALRWWAAGTHRGPGRFGKPSGAPVLMLGVTHLRIADDLVVREWTVTDELAVLRQMAAARGVAS
jgi:hypothetical protein